MHIEKHVDVVHGLQYGDEGKGKIAASLAATKQYEYTARYNGGPNAGHTVHTENGVLKLHQLPTSIACKQLGYIGPGALIDFTKLEEEARNFRNVMGFCPYKYLKISPKAIQILPRDIVMDSEYHHKSQGSTASGVAPAYSRFYNRTAQLANTYTWPDEDGLECIVDLKRTDSLLLEGAQGFYLNPYQGKYPYTTSSSSHPAQAASNFGFSPRKFRNIIGVAKCYETRSGKDPFFNRVVSGDMLITPVCDQHINDIYNHIVNVGKEYGVTTGRRRSVRFIDMNRLVMAIRQTGTNILVLQKWDILEAVGIEAHSFYLHGKLKRSVANMKDRVFKILKDNCPDLEHIIYSESPVDEIEWGLYL